MKIGFLMLRYPPERTPRTLPQAIRLLGEWGAHVDVIYPEETVVDLSTVRPEHDLYILKSRTEMALLYAGALHAAGATILNPYPVSAILRDKITTSRILQVAGVPIPATWLTDKPDKLAHLLEDGPLAIKQCHGPGLRGVHVVWDAEELDDVPTTQGPILAQRFVVKRGRARKICCIGGQLFGVMRVFPAATYEEKVGVAFTVTPRLQEIALRVGSAFGIEVFALDVIGDDEDPQVVDVQSFPSFKGVPDAPLRLSDYIYGVVQRVLSGKPPLPSPAIPAPARPSGGRVRSQEGGRS